MLDVSQNALLTIAGTGGVGFAGDGGLGREALLRHPEGLALKPNLADGQEVLGQMMARNAHQLLLRDVETTLFDLV